MTSEHSAPRPRVVAGATLAVMAMLLGVGSADGWRIHPQLLGVLASLQAVWALGAFAAGRWAANGHTRVGFLAGALFGATAITSYYAYEWIAYTAVAATSQLTSSGGLFWCLAAVLGGGVVGIAGALSARTGGGLPIDSAAVGWALPVAIILSEIVYVLSVHRPPSVGDPLGQALVVLTLGGAGMLAAGIRHCGPRAMVIAGACLGVVTPLAAVAFFTLEHRVGYVTL